MTNAFTGSIGSKHTVGSILATSTRNFSALWLLAAFVITFTFTAPDTFPTTLTLKIVLTDQVTIGLLALAVLVPLSANAFDFSVGAMLAFSMVVTSTLANKDYSMLEASLVAIIGCGLFGALNGLLIVRFRINSFIATIGTSQLLTALSLLITKNQQIIPKISDTFVSLTHGTIFGINHDVVVLFGLAIVLWMFLEHTPTGRSLFATGGNPEAARLAGVPTNLLTVVSLVISALIAGLAGVLLLSKVGVYTQEFGPGYLFPAFAAAFFGSTQIKGRPNVWGTLIAVYVLAVGVAGLQLTFFGNEYWITPLFNGTALLVAVAFASRRHVGRAYRRLRKGLDGGPGSGQPGSHTDGGSPADGPTAAGQAARSGA